VLRWAALAAGLLAAAGLSWYALEPRQPHRGGEPARVAQERSAPAGVSQAPQPQGAPPATPEPVKAVFQLALTSLRGSEVREKLRVHPGAGVVELQIAVAGMEDLKSFHLSVRDGKGATLWNESALEPKTLDGVRALVVDLPADRLPAGTYEIQAQGLVPGGEPEDLSPLEIEVVREGKR